ncbi:MAG: phosphodiester glycosidase family protein [Parvularculaceae bacterium]
MKLFSVFFLACAAFLASGVANAACREAVKDDQRYAVCAFDPENDDIRLFLNGADGAPYGDFTSLEAVLGGKNEKLLFAMNAGMYRKDRSPAGLYIEEGEEARKLSTRDGPGNFHLKPNGVFWIGADGAAHVTETETYKKAAPEARFATQSGPMLVIDGEIHPKFLKDSTSRKRRNGVGVKDDGSVVFVLADAPVTLFDFASFFRDDLECPNALYLDGSISRLYAPELDRNDGGLPMGPMVGVVGK